jgi:hypothetical protein
MMDDAGLLASCEIDTYRASGPGGQKRNKTSSAVRIRHLPTSLVVTATESRSQHENRDRALRRLRQAIALTQRNAIDRDSPAPDFLAGVLRENASLHLSPKHPDYFLIVQHVLDVLAAAGVSVSEAAAALNLSTGQLIRFLKDDPKLWERTNQMRREAGLTVLR